MACSDNFEEFNLLSSQFSTCHIEVAVSEALCIFATVELECISENNLLMIF